MGILTNLQPGDVLFVDEIHRIPRTIEEYLYPAMEDFAVDFVLDKGPYARSDQAPVQAVHARRSDDPSRAARLTAQRPLRALPHLDFYTPTELEAIVRRSAYPRRRPGRRAAAEIARRSRGTPRIANRLLRRVRDYAQVKGNGVVTATAAGDALDREGVDGAGLDRLDRRFLIAIIEQYRGGPVGLEAIAATINDEAETLAEVVEPFLLKIGYVVRSPNGRKATAAAYAHLGYGAPAGESSQGQLPLG